MSKPPLHDVKRTMLDSLTSLRFFAAMSVFTWHLRGLINIPLVNWAQTGYIGVSFFYVLSGFILTYVYTQKLSAGEVNSIKKFYISRVAKLWPVHLLTFVLSLPLVFVFGQYTVSSHASSQLLVAALSDLTLTQAWVPNNGFNFSFNGVAWSLSVEVFFYTLFPAIIYLLSKVWRKLTTRQLVIIMAILWTLTMAIYLQTTAAMDDWRFYVLPLARLPDFLMGVLLGLTYLTTRRSQQLVITRARGTSYELASLVLLAVAMMASSFLPQSIRFSVWLLPVWAYIIFVFSWQSGIISRALVWRPLVFLGEASFSFYMIHQLVIRYISLEHLPPLATIAVSLVSAVVLSGVMYVVFEEPARIHVKNFLEAKLIRARKLQQSAETMTAAD